MANSQQIAHFIPTEPDFEFYAIYKNTWIFNHRLNTTLDF